MTISFSYDGGVTLTIVPENQMDKLALEEMTQACAKGTSAVIAPVPGDGGWVTVSMSRGVAERRER